MGSKLRGLARDADQLMHLIAARSGHVPVLWTPSMASIRGLRSRYAVLLRGAQNPLVRISGQATSDGTTNTQSEHRRLMWSGRLKVVLAPGFGVCLEWTPRNAATPMGWTLNGWLAVPAWWEAGIASLARPQLGLAWWRNTTGRQATGRPVAVPAPGIGVCQE